MRDFDKLRADRDLEFKVGGQVFQIQVMPLKIIGVWAEREKEVNAEDLPAFQAMCIDRIADAVNDGNGAAERWRELCASDKGPSYGELLELTSWVWEAQSELPTMQPAPSEPGRGKTAASSKAG